MQEEPTDPMSELILDGNAAAGILEQVFGTEMTLSPTECGSCGRVSQLGETRAYTHAPGTILRCPACDEIMLRIVETPAGVYLDARGAASIRFRRRAPDAQGGEPHARAE